MTTDPRNWRCSAVDRVTLQEQIGTFLRTHTTGVELLLDWMASVPADRTEAEYAATARLSPFNVE